MSRFVKTGKGPVRRPNATIITGRPGIGKTYLASEIPGVFWIPVEQGLSGANPERLEEIQRFKNDDGSDAQPQTLGEFLEMLQAIPAVKEPHIKHVVVDSTTGLEKLVNKQACKQESVLHMEAKEFKKVWSATAPMWERIRKELDILRDKHGLHVWVIAHAQEITETASNGEIFSKWDIRFDGSGAVLGSIREGWRTWADHVLFIDWDSVVTPGKVMAKKAVGKYNARVLRTRETPQHFAKNRASLPPILPATWRDLAAAFAAASPASEAKLREQIAAVAGSLGTEEQKAIKADMETAKTTQALSAVLSRAQGMLSVAKEEETEAQESAPEETA